MTHVQHILTKAGAFLRKIWWVVLIAAIIGGYLLYTSHSAQAQVDEDLLYTVERQTLRDSISLAGSINAEERVSVSFPQSGKLTWVGVKEGERVKQYQGLASLDQRQLEKQIKKNLNMYLQTRTNFDQTVDDNDEYHLQPDSDEGDRMKRLIEISQANLDNAVLDVEIQTIAKEDAFLFSPIAGIVTKARHPYPGVNVSTSQVEFEIINPDSLYFSASADQVDVIKLANGMTGDITLDSFIDDEIPGVIQDISFTPVQGELGTSYEVKISFSSPTTGNYRLGMTGDVSFTINEFPDVVAIPSGYLQIDENGQSYVMKMTKNDGIEETVKTPISISDEYQGNIIVTEGLNEGDVIYLSDE
jgi:RND family efflux transporter MFP subunit